MWLTILSDQLPVIALVSRYLTNKLIGRGLLFKRQVPCEIPAFSHPDSRQVTTFGISPAFARLSPS